MATNPKDLERFFQRDAEQTQTERQPVSSDELEHAFQTGKRPPDSNEQAPGYVGTYGIRSDMFEPEDLKRIGSNLMVGVSRLFGFPGDVDETLFTDDSLFPTSQEIQSAYADVGLTYQPEETPQGFVDRSLQEMGTTSLPVGGTIAYGRRLIQEGVEQGKRFMQRQAIEAGRRPVRTAAVEGSASMGAAGGGILGERLAPNNPQVGRAIGELSGGLSGGFTGAFISSGGGMGALYRGAQSAGAPYSAEGSRRRATRRVQRSTMSPETARRNLEESQDIMEEVPELTPAQVTGDPYLAQLEQAVKQDNPQIMESLKERTDTAVKRLQEIARGSGNVEDYKNLLDAKLKNTAARAARHAYRLRKTRPNADLSSETFRFLDDAYEKGSTWEKKVWSRVPESETADLSDVRSIWEDELKNVTKGADRSKIPNIIRNKIGDLTSKGTLSEGELGKNPSAKAVHQFYSELGEKIKEEANKASPSRNKLRRLNEVREAVWTALTNVPGGQKYQEAIDYSRNFNRKFTQGATGEILGFARAGGPTPQTETLEVLMGRTGEAQRNAVKQLLKASPETEESIKNFIRNRFIDSTFNVENGRINSVNGGKFLNQYRQLLKEFPDLRKQLHEATHSQRNVDELLAVSDVTDLSPRKRAQRAAGVFLQAPPGEEIARVVQQGRKGPFGTTHQFKELVKQAREDDTGNAMEGLKAAFVDHVMAKSRQETISGEFIPHGKNMLKNLNELAGSAVRSGLMASGEVRRLRKIARIFEGIQQAERAKTATGGVISDAPATLVRIASRIIPARLTQLTPSGGAGVGLQEAQLAASEGQSFVRRLTNKGAYSLIAQSVQDGDLMLDLQRNIDKMSPKEQKKWVNRLKVRLPQGGLAPPTTTAVGAKEQNGEDQE